ncbi:fanconi-associated nuclease 1-like isoform X2 [Zerene cesonia]|uniref:fanconi-associated nuclease 1-like isoform X2 n=1 Tax=Zerene cesonia TaxID=33412 RepID=UPI0018E4E099|nr:fanconi-associated nuclease 1-like isoform X2 [Zerene cesonia]
MSRQLTLDRFYKSRVSKTLKFEMDSSIKKRITDSPAVASPSKSPKLKQENETEHVINLISDDEDEIFNSLISENENQIEELCSDSSNVTIIYTPPDTKSSPATPKSTPNSARKYFSPNKKRNMYAKTPSKAKRNLTNELKMTKTDDEGKSTEFEQLCTGLDDKTIYMVKTIYEYLNDAALKPLLDPTSQDLLVKCLEVVKPGMQLVCRLYWRKEGWYRVHTLQNIVSSVGAISEMEFKEMLNCLVANKLLVPIGKLDEKEDLQLSDGIDMLKVNEVKAICKELKLKFTTKEEAKHSLELFSRQSNIGSFMGLSTSSNRKRVLNMISMKLGPCYKLSDLCRRTLNELYILMYLGMDYNILREKKLELVILYDKINREPYPIDEDIDIDNASVVFKNRLEFQRYIKASTIYEQFLECTNSQDKCRLVEKVYNLYLNIDKAVMTSYKSLPTWLRKFTPAYFYISIMHSGIVDLRKLSHQMEGYCELALDILTELIQQNTFKTHKKAEWYAEKALIYENLMKCPDKAAEVLIEGFNMDIPEEEMDCMRPRALKLVNRRTNKICEELAPILSKFAQKESILEKNIKSRHIYKQPMESYGRGKLKFQVRSSDGTLMVLEAEEYCKYYYINLGEYTHGGHWEGRIITTLFFLLFWDIIYANLRGVRGVFLSRYQRHPLDMFDDFYENRKCLIEERLKEIENASEEEIVERMKRVWDARPEGEQSGIVRAVGWAGVRGAARGLRARGLAALCARLAARYRHARAAFPDLTLWNEDTGEVIFVEVKTDSDKPSLKQLQWMSYLRENGINTEICYVGVNTTRCKARNTENV